MELVDRSRFIQLLVERYPEIAAGIDECSAGLLHPEMGTIARATQAAIDAGDEETTKRHFALIDEVLANAAPDVENAIYVSYLEHLRFEGRSASAVKARGLLTPKLQKALAEVEAFWAHGEET